MTDAKLFIDFDSSLLILLVSLLLLHRYPLTAVA
jgi:hypothetical protein